MPVDTLPRGRWQLWVLVAFVVTLATAIPTMVDDRRGRHHPRRGDAGR